MACRNAGFEPRPKEPLAFVKRNRVLPIRHSKTGFQVDLALGALPFEEEVTSRAVRLKLGRFQCPVASPEDLIIMKLVAARPKDLEDVRGLLTFHQVDQERILRIVAEFAEALEDPDLQTLAKKLLKQPGRYSSADRAKD